MKKKSENETLLSLVIGFAVVLGIYSVLETTVAIQGVITNGILGSPPVYAMIVASILCITTLAMSRSINKKYLAVGIISAIISISFVWIYGVTSAGDFLVDEVNRGPALDIESEQLD